MTALTLTTLALLTSCLAILLWVPMVMFLRLDEDVRTRPEPERRSARPRVRPTSAAELQSQLRDEYVRQLLPDLEETPPDLQTVH